VSSDQENVGAMGAPDEALPKPRRRAVWILASLLLVSLVLNLAMGGFIAARVSRYHEQAGMIHGMKALSQQMSEEDRKILRRTFASHWQDFRRLRREKEEIANAVRNAMRAEPFDEAALRAAMERLSAQLQQGGAVFQTVMIEAAAQLSPAGREALSRFRPDGAGPRDRDSFRKQLEQRPERGEPRIHEPPPANRIAPPAQ
jgi:uncharacterized membrane protein